MTMSDIGIIIMLYGAGLLLLIAEIFIPSHGVLTVASIVLLTIAVIKTFAYGEFAGTMAIVSCLIALPIMAVVSVKLWPHTWIGKRIAPANPVYDKDRDFGSDQRSLESLLGKTGRTISPLRPVGTCVFDGKRIDCIAEMGMIDAQVDVVATEVRGRTLAVQAISAMA